MPTTSYNLLYILILKEEVAAEKYCVKYEENVILENVYFCCFVIILVLKGIRKLFHRFVVEKRNENVFLSMIYLYFCWYFLYWNIVAVARALEIWVGADRKLWNFQEKLSLGWVSLYLTQVLYFPLEATQQSDFSYYFTALYSMFDNFFPHCEKFLLHHLQHYVTPTLQMKFNLLFHWYFLNK